MKSIFGIFLMTALVFFSPKTHALEYVNFKATSKYKGKPITLKGELSKPVGPGPFPAVVLMHGCGGWQPSVHQALRVHAKYLVKNGFVALNLDSFGPRRISGGWVCKQYSRLGAARVYRQVDAFDAMKFLQRKRYVERDNIFQMGQSNGGSVAVLLAQTNSLILHGERVFGDDAKPFRGTAAYYPWCGALSKGYGVELVASLIAFVGDRDDWTPSAGCKKVNAKGQEYKVIVYERATHAFDLKIKLQRYLGFLVGYDRQATADSRRQMVAFFRSKFTEDLKSITPMSVLEIQQLLKNFGYQPGPIDGSWGAKTLSALNELRHKHGLDQAQVLEASSYKLLRSLQ